MVRVFDNEGRTPDRYTVFLGDQAFTFSPPEIPAAFAVAQALGPIEGVNFAALGKSIRLDELPADVRREVNRAANTVLRALIT